MAYCRAIIVAGTVPFLRCEMKLGVLGDTDFPRLIMSRAGVRPARDIINLGKSVSPKRPTFLSHAEKDTVRATMAARQ